MELLPLDDERWLDYFGAYGEECEGLTDWIEILLHGDFDDTHWAFMWQELYDREIVGEASYAIVPYLAAYAREYRRFEWQLFSFSAAVELARLENDNPDVPEEIELSYFHALNTLADMAAFDLESWDDLQAPCMAAIIALSKNQRIFARTYMELNSKERAINFLQDEMDWVPGEQDL